MHKIALLQSLIHRGPRKKLSLVNDNCIGYTPSHKFIIF